jgi:hypothetical protein
VRPALLLSLLHALMEDGSRVSARRPRYLSLRRQRNVPQRKATPLPVSPSHFVRGGSLRCLVLGCAAELAAFFELRSNSCGKHDNDARVLRHAPTPGPALLGTVRRGWERVPLGPSLRSAGAERSRQCRRQRTALNQHPAQLRKQQPSLTPLLTPAGCAEERRSWGGCVCRRTHALRRLAHRRCLSGVRSTQRVLRCHPRSEHRRLPAAKRRDADWGPPSLW